MLARFKAWAKTLKQEVIALWFAYRHPNTPWYTSELLPHQPLHSPVKRIRDEDLGFVLADIEKVRFAILVRSLTLTTR